MEIRTFNFPHVELQYYWCQDMITRFNIIQIINLKYLCAINSCSDFQNPDINKYDNKANDDNGVKTDNEKSGTVDTVIF